MIKFTRVIIIFAAIIGGQCICAALSACSPERSAGTETNVVQSDVGIDESLEYLKKYMPERDRGRVSDEYLRKNAEFALKAWSRTPWQKDVPAEIFLNDVLPYSSIGEDADEWRPVFYEKFYPLVKNCRTTTEAAEKLNSEIWKIIGVTYNTKRDKPDQSPFHSMRIGMASCTGLSIILIDACRAVGVPARFAGCNWKNKPGNHSWVEIWDRGGWHYIGAEDEKKVDKAWFDADAACAIANDPRYSIYASSWKRTGTTFYGTWCENPITTVPAENVTARYTKNVSGASENPSLLLDIISHDGARVSVPVRLEDAASGKLLASGITHDETFDLNDHLSFSFPAGTKVLIVADDDNQTKLGEFTFFKGAGMKVVKLKIGGDDMNKEKKK